ncbi:hypothetical protein V8C44DRAFT_352353 [Trichoderma aethiopicum]
MCKARAFCSAGFFSLFLLLCAGGEWMRCICEAYVLCVYLMREVAGRHIYLGTTRPLPDGSIYIIIGDIFHQRQSIPRPGGNKHRHPIPVSLFSQVQ